MTSDPPEPRPGTAQPDAIRAGVTLPRPTIAIRPNLWHNWARIAMKAEARALAAHRRGISTGEIADALEAETLECMVAVSGVRHSFHHLYLDCHLLLGLEPAGDEPKVPRLATTDLPLDDNDLRSWLDDLQQVVVDRDEIVHISQESRPAVPHPLGTNTSEFDARFTAERATRAVDLMLDFYRKVIASPSAAMRPWAEKRAHVPGDLNNLRAKYRAREDGS